MFALHTRLQEDTIALGEFPLSLLLMMNDATYPWFILVPRRPGIREIYELSEEDQGQLLWESSHLSRTASAVFDADKFNIAALGNLVPQLHIHHVVRYQHDPAWPAPVWGHSAPCPYDDTGREKTASRLTRQLESFVPRQFL